MAFDRICQSGLVFKMEKTKKQKTCKTEKEE